MTTPCDCPVPGWCERHQFTKTVHTHWLCQTREDYRKSWDDVADKRRRKLTLTEKAKSLAQATYDWMKSGLRLRTPARRREIMDLCRSCKHFNAGKCALCECNLQMKIAMATTSCPASPPLWGVDFC